MDIGTTSIDSLPMSPQGQGQPIQQVAQQQQQQQQPQQQQQQENIKLEMDHNKFQQQRDNDPAINQQNLNQFVTGIQQASAAGMTALPSRDIPQNQESLTRDQQMKPNYIPAAENTDYIREHQNNNEEMIREYARRQQKTDSLDNMYNELQIPILIAVLYFTFQLPVVRKNLFKFLPSLFSKDGNPNLSGYITNSLIFGALYFGLTKGMKYFAI
jgi:hypothetical protein